MKLHRACLAYSIVTVNANGPVAEQMCAAGRGPDDEARSTNETSVDGPFA